MAALRHRSETTPDRATAPHPGSVLVIGYGNPLRTDDGVGPVVAARLAADARLAGVEVRAEHQLTPELALDASRVSLLVLVDAGAAESPGEIAVRRVEPSGEAGVGWTHQLDPSRLLGLSRELWGSAPSVVLVSIGPGSLELGDSLTPIVAAAVDRAAGLVADIVEEQRRA